MSKVTTPEPRWYAAMHGQALYGVFDTPEAAFEAVSDTPGLITIDRLITTAQAEAYKDACVREALEKAAQVAEFSHPAFHSPKTAAAQIRALIPPQQ